MKKLGDAPVTELYYDEDYYDSGLPTGHGYKLTEDYFLEAGPEGGRLLQIEGSVQISDNTGAVTSDCPTYMKSWLEVCYCTPYAPTPAPTPPPTSAPTSCEDQLATCEEQLASLQAAAQIDPDSCEAQLVDVRDELEDAKADLATCYPQSGGCEADPSWYKKDAPSKDCSWASENAAKRCNTKGWDRRTGSEACCITC